MANNLGSTCLASIEFVALHVSVSEKTSTCLQTALERNNRLRYVRFEACQDGDGDYMTVQEVARKAMRKHLQRCEHKPPSLQAPLFSRSIGKGFLDASFSQSSDWGSAIVAEGEHGEDLVLRSGKLSCADSLSETDVGDAEAEAVTTTSTEAPIWESLGA